MNTKFNFRSIVFQRAYILFRKTGCSFSEALRQAWNRYREYKNRVVSELANRINGFDFHYHYSDDSRVYRHYSDIRKEISEQVQSLPHSFISAIQGQLNPKAELNFFTL